MKLVTSQYYIKWFCIPTDGWFHFNLQLYQNIFLRLVKGTDKSISALNKVHWEQQ